MTWIRNLTPSNYLISDLFLIFTSILHIVNFISSIRSFHNIYSFFLRIVNFISPTLRIVQPHSMPGCMRDVSTSPPYDLHLYPHLSIVNTHTSPLLSLSLSMHTHLLQQTYTANTEERQTEQHKEGKEGS